MANNPGFGLNYDQGFGTGKMFVGQQRDPQLDQIARQALEQQRAQQQGADQAMRLQQPKLDLSRYQTDQGNALQRELSGQNNALQRYQTDQNNATQRQGIDTGAATDRYKTDVGSQTQKYGIDANALLQRDVTAANNQQARYGVDTNAALQRDITGANNATQRYGVDTNALLQRDITGANNATQRYGIDTGANTARYQTDVGSQTQQAIAAQQSALQRYLGDQSNQTQRYGVDTNAAQRQREAELQAGTSREGFWSQERIAGVNADASRYAPTLQQQRFDKVFPLLSSSLSGEGQFGGAGGGPPGVQPQISAAPVYSEDQIQQKVNAQRAANDQSTATKARDVGNQLAGRGFGANSPLAQLLQQGLFSQNLVANTGNERDTRLGAAEKNSQQVLAGQTAQEQQYASRQDEANQRRQIQAGQRNALIAALSGLV